MFLLEFLFCRTGFVIACIGSAVGMEIFNDANRPVYVAVDENDSVMGYAFCIKKKQPFSTNMVPFDSLFIDDLCVDQNIRGKHVGQKIFEHVKELHLTFGKATIQPADFMKKWVWFQKKHRWNLF